MKMKRIFHYCLLLSFTGRRRGGRGSVGGRKEWPGRETEVSNIILLFYTVICCIDYCFAVVIHRLEGEDREVEEEDKEVEGEDRGGGGDGEEEEGAI